MGFEENHDRIHKVDNLNDHRQVPGVVGGNIVVIDPVTKLPIKDSGTSLASILGGIKILGEWNAATNTPALASGVGVAGNGYFVSTPGATDLDGINDWKQKDIAWFDGVSSTWKKIDNTELPSWARGTAELTGPTPPITPIDDGYYLITTGGTGIFLGKDGQVGHYTTLGGWTYSTPDPNDVWASKSPLNYYIPGAGPSWKYLWTLISHLSLKDITANQHHDKQHPIAGSAEHTSTIGENSLMAADTNGLPKDADADLISLARNVPSAGWDYVEIGSFAGLSHTLILSIFSNEAAYEESQIYIINAIKNHTAGAWEQVIPITKGNELYTIFIMVNNTDMYLRVARNTSAPAIKQVAIKILNLTTNAFTSLTGTGTQGVAPFTKFNPFTTFDGAGKPGIIPDPVTETGKVLTDDGTWAIIRPTVEGEIWVFDSATADADPTSGKFRLNNATQPSATYMYISNEPQSGADLEELLLLLKEGDYIYIEQIGDATKYHAIYVDGDAIDGTGYYKIPIQIDDSGTDIDDGEDVVIIFHFSSEYTDAEARLAVKYKADVTSATSDTPIQSEFSAWSVGDRGIGIGQTGRIFMVYKDGASSIKYVELS